MHPAGVFTMILDEQF